MVTSYKNSSAISSCRYAFTTYNLLKFFPKLSLASRSSTRDTRYYSSTLKKFTASLKSPLMRVWLFRFKPGTRGANHSDAFTRLRTASRSILAGTARGMKSYGVALFCRLISAVALMKTLRASSKILKYLATMSLRDVAAFILFASQSPIPTALIQPRSRRENQDPERRIRSLGAHGF